MTGFAEREISLRDFVEWPTEGIDDALYHIDRTTARSIINTIDSLQYELGEAKSEINRHHRDFRIIRDILDLNGEGTRVEQAIRNVVG